MERNYTHEDIRRFRDAYSCSMTEAKAHFEKRFFLDTIAEARQTGNQELLIDIVEELIKRTDFR